MLLLLTVSSSGCINETKPVNQLPIALLFADATYGKAPFNISFTGSGTDYDGAITSYHWDFGDGSTSDLQNPNHTYVDDGEFVVNLTVTDDDGETGSDILKINVIGNYYPIAYASADKTVGEAPFNISFTGSGTDYDGAITSYHWDFGDGSTSDLQNPNHTYVDDGEFVVNLTVTDDDGETGSDILKINVIGNYYPIAYASAGTIKGRAPLKVQFYGEGKDEGDGNLSYHWDFEDTLIPKNGESNKQNPTHTYWREGIYKAKLTVKNDDGSKDTDYIEITVEKNLVLSMLPNPCSSLQTYLSTLGSVFIFLTSCVNNLIGPVLKLIITIIEIFLPDEKLNAPPYTPNNSIPASGSENVSINAKLCWTSGDPNFFDKVSYAVYFGDSTPPPRVVNKQPGTTYDPKEMNHNTTYYWRIVARDMLFHFASSPIWCFTTK